METARSSAVAVVLLLISTSASAFTGDEHKELTRLGLKVALTYAESRGLASPVIASAREMDKECDEESARCVAFLAIVADWFQKPEERLSPPSEIWAAIEDREKSPLRHLLALHRNDRHFQRQAAEAYGKIHGLGIKGRDDPTKALYAEAIAQHFLHDFFAAGHVMTPRAGFNSPSSASVHDRFSREGLRFVLPADFIGRDREAKGGFLDMSEALQQLLATNPDAGGEHDLEPAILREGRNEFTFAGDGTLDKPTEDAIAQKTFLVLLSAHSWMEVFTDDVAPMNLCFSKREGIINGWTMKLVKLPRAGAGWVDGAGGSPECDERFAHYNSEVPDPDMVSHETGLWSMGFGWGASIERGSEMRSTSIDRLVIGTGPRRETLHTVTKEPLQPMDTAVGFGLSYLQGPSFESFGMHVRYESPWKGFTPGLMVGGRRYVSESKASTKPIYGARLSYGLEVVNLVASVEWGHEWLEDGSMVKATAIQLGGELNASNSWGRLIYRSARDIYRKRSHREVGKTPSTQLLP